MKIIFYSKKNQKQPVYEFLDKLPKKDKAKIFSSLKNIEELGFDSPRVNFRQIKGALWEIKIRVQSGGYRLFYVTIQSDLLVLLHAYKKHSQKAPLKEIEVAEKRMLEVINDEKSVYTR